MGRKSLAKNRKEKTDKVRKWMQALLPLLQTRTLTDLTMDDIAELMNRSKSTIYEYFNSKEEVLTYAVQVRVNHLKTYRDHFDLSEKALLTTYEQFMEGICRGVEDISISFLNDLKTHYSSIWKAIEGFLATIIEDLSKMYQLGIQYGYFRSVSVDLLLALDNFFVAQLITDHTFFETKNISLEELIREYLQLRMNGLKRQ